VTSLLHGSAAFQVRDNRLDSSASLGRNLPDHLSGPGSEAGGLDAQVPDDVLGLFPGTDSLCSLPGGGGRLLGALRFQDVQLVQQGGDPCTGIPDKLPRTLYNGRRDAKAAGNINGEAATRKPDM
jgi:hypothetical protein